MPRVRLEEGEVPRPAASQEVPRGVVGARYGGEPIKGAAATINHSGREAALRARIEATHDDADDALWDAIAVKFPGHQQAYERLEENEALAVVHSRSYTRTRVTITAFVEKTSTLL